MYDLHLIFYYRAYADTCPGEGGKRDITEMSEVLDFGGESDGEAGVYGVDDAVLEGEYVVGGGCAVGVDYHEGLRGP